MRANAYQITSLTIVYSAVYVGADQRKYQSSASLALVLGIHRRPVNSPHKWPVTRKMFPFDDVIMSITVTSMPNHLTMIHPSITDWLGWTKWHTTYNNKPTIPGINSYRNLAISVECKIPQKYLIIDIVSLVISSLTDSKGFALSRLVFNALERTPFNCRTVLSLEAVATLLCGAFSGELHERQDWRDRKYCFVNAF